MHGTTGMASKHREPNGRHQREKSPAPTQVKRLRDAALAGMTQPEWGTELGRLFLNDVITDAMYAAGKRWREWAATFHKAIGVFPVRSASPQTGRAGSPPDPDSPEGQKIARRESDAAERFFAAHAALTAAGAREERIVRALCERNEAPCGFEELMRLRKGLLALVSHWDLTSTGKSVSHVKSIR